MSNLGLDSGPPNGKSATAGVELRGGVGESSGGRARAKEIGVGQEAEARVIPPAAPEVAGEQLVRDALDEVARAEQRLRVAATPSERSQAVFGQLAEAARRVASIGEPDALVAAVPALALALCPGAAVALLEVGPIGAVRVVAEGGRPFALERARIDAAAVEVARATRTKAADGGGALAPASASGFRHIGGIALLPVAPRAADGWVLAVESHAQADGELEAVAILASLVGSAVEAARARASYRDVASRDAAVLAAIREGVLVVDRDGIVQGANPVALSALRARRDDLVGHPLRDVAGLQALADAIAGGADGEVVTVPRGEVTVRSQPFENGVVATIHDVTTERATGRRSVGPTARYTFENLVGVAPSFLRVLEDASRAAHSDMPILVCGESGTGKELLAQAIHNASPRATEPFVGVNVTAIPRELPESELFGYEGGAFTGAKSGGNAGKFELAGSGTLLLDEIGDMPMEMQAKLLRVLQERLVQRVGSARDVRVRARIIATSHRDLPEAVSTGRFRLDLYHRLCVIHLHLPPLRERKGDVPLIVEHQLRLHAERTGRRVRVAPQVMDLLEAYDWPGNVRELVNLVEGELGVLAPGEDAFTRLPETLLLAREPSAEGAPQVLSLEELERRACEETLARFNGNVARAAAALGVAKGTLYAKMKRYGLDGTRATPLPRNGAAHASGAARPSAVGRAVGPGRPGGLSTPSSRPNGRFSHDS
jgi:transcriptional regulator with PAS, ATPase and Fis domain